MALLTAGRNATLVLSISIVAVLVGGIVTVATSGGGSGAPSAGAGAGAKPTASAPGSTGTTASPRPKAKPTSPAYLHPLGHVPNPKPGLVIGPGTSQRHAVLNLLSHPAHEAWSRLLVRAPSGSTTPVPPRPLNVKQVSKDFAQPAPVERQLRFNGYSRGIDRTTLTGHLGDIEQLWQFHRPTGAGEFYLAYLRSNLPGSDSEFRHTFAIGHDGARGYTGTHIDTAGYHFGVGVALEGDILVHVRLFSSAPVTRTEIESAMRRALPPVARGIRFAGAFARSLLRGGRTATQPVTA